MKNASAMRMFVDEAKQEMISAQLEDLESMIEDAINEDPSIGHYILRKVDLDLKSVSIEELEDLGYTVVEHDDVGWMISW